MLHLALSSLLAPLLILYGLSSVQMIDGTQEYLPEMPIIEQITYNFTKVHQSYRLSESVTEYESKDPYRLVAVVFSIGLILLSILSIVAGLGTRGVRIVTILFLLVGIHTSVGYPASRWSDIHQKRLLPNW